jgi:purine-binding chemotaxis protein CheW
MLVTFSVGSRRCALPVSDVEEVLRIVALTPAAGAPPFIEGVINRRGVATPVIDLRKRYGMACGPYDSTTHIVITALRGRNAGLIVDAVHDVVDGAELLAVIDPSSILNDAESREFDAARFA